jgi:hypothetical protein
MAVKFLLSLKSRKKSTHFELGYKPHSNLFNSADDRAKMMSLNYRKMTRNNIIASLVLVSSFMLISCGDGERPLTNFNPSPPVADFDHDGIPDKDDMDGDNDGLIDIDERSVNLDPYNAADALEDNDNDGFNNTEEFYLNTQLDDPQDYPLALPWNSFQGSDGRSGFNLQLVEPDRISLLWTREGNAMSAVVANQSGVYFAETKESKFPLTMYGDNATHLLRLTPKNGDIQWETIVESTYLNDELGDNETSVSIGGAYHHSLALADETIYFGLGGSFNSPTQSFDAVFSTIITSATGEINKSFVQFISGGYPRAPTYSNGRYYLTGGIVSEYGTNANVDGTLFPQTDWTPTVRDEALFQCTGLDNPETGLTKSNITEDTDKTRVYSETTLANWDGCAIGTAPVIGHFNNLITVGNGKLSSIELENRSILWQLPVSNVQPSIAFGKVYAALENKLLSVNEYSGDIIWEYEDMGDISSNIIVTRNMLFFSTPTQTIGLDSETGEYLWSVAYSGELTLSHGMLYIQQRDLLLAYSLN